VDYLQLMVSGQEGKFSREQEVSNISRSLKAIAKELDVPIIALSQMSRAVEQRGGSKRPQLSDLRESGAIEQDADLVMFIYRADMAGITQDENGNSTEGLAEIIIAKHRNGRVGSENLLFISQFAKFVEPSSSTVAFSEDDLGGGNSIIRGSKMNDIEEDL
jgi:replicative DNA helicase